jgi:hypothetical protein
MMKERKRRKKKEKERKRKIKNKINSIPVLLSFLATVEVVAVQNISIFALVSGLSLGRVVTI